MIGQITNHLWQSTIFAVAAGILTFAFRRNRAQIRYWLWFTASCKFLIPFALLMSLGRYVEPTTRRIALPAVSQTISGTIVQINEPFPESLSPSPSPRGDEDWIATGIVVVWVGGFAGIALLRFRGWLRVRAAVRTSTPMNIPAPVDVRASPGLLEPGVVGWIRPVLLLPSNLVERLSARQFDAVMAHELCHVRRRDNLTSAIHMIVEAGFWFHPLVWWIGARLLEERERACDEEVLSLGSQPRDYAEGILECCKNYLESPLRCVSGVTGYDLKKRIHAILTGQVARNMNFAGKIALAVSAIGALTLPFVIGMMHAQPSAAPRFDVAAIKASRDSDCAGGGTGVGMKKKKKKGGPGGESPSPGTFNVDCQTVANLIRMAYLEFPSGKPFPIDPATGRIIQAFNADRRWREAIRGGPAWIDSDFYAINAKSESAQTREMMRGPMTQALLEDRFRLKLHREPAEQPVYELTVAPGGPKLQAAQGGTCITETELIATLGTLEHFPVVCGAFTQRPTGADDSFRQSMAGLARELSRLLDRDVIDKTGIDGVFDIHMQLTLADLFPGGLPPQLRDRAQELPNDPGGSLIFSAVRKLGLKLEPANVKSYVIVIDHVERPSAN